MGHKYKNKKKGGHQNSSSSSNFAPKLTQQQLCELVAEATQMHMLLNSRIDKLKQCKDFVHILSTKWLREWKDYVGYQQLVTDDKQANNKKRGKKRPGPPNTDLIINSKSYLQIPEQLQQYQFLNTIINQKLEVGDDFIGVTPEIWEQFNSIYGPGIEIKRPFRITKSKTVYIDGNLMKCDFVFINYNQENFLSKIQQTKLNKNSYEQIIPYYNIQFSKIWTFQDLYRFLQKLCLVKFNCQKINLWLSENFIGTFTIQQNFIKSAKSKKYEMYAQKLQLQNQDFEDLDLDDFLKQNYTILIQIGDSKIVSAQLPQDISGYCQQCVQKKNLKYQCECHHKFYCSRQCQTDDQVFHFNLCSLAFNNIDDQIYNKKKIANVSNISRCGLKNLGNTCYMNSSLQTFINLSFFVDFFSTNKYKDHISKKQKHAQLFLQNVSKFCKRMGQQTQMNYFEPWDLKGQINYFLVPFKGYKQHDAIDFFMGFINTINECLQKPENEAYHPLFKQNLVGDFDSLVICPQCGNQVKNFQCFTQLTLPIKSKVKKTLYNYVLFDNPLSYKHGKAEVKQKWSQIKQDMGVDSDCIIFGGSDSESGFVNIDFDTNSQSFFKKFKKQILFYPYQTLKHNQVLFSANFITMKNVSGINMRANFGYPFPIKADNSKTIGHFFIDLVRKINLDKNPQILQQLQLRYDQIMKQKIQKLKQAQKQQQSTVSTEVTKGQNSNKKNNNKQKKMQEKKSNSKDKSQQIQQNTTQKQLQELNDQLINILQDLNLTVYIEDTKKMKNICFFCKKRCDGCLYLPDFKTNVQDSLGLKENQVRFFIHIEPKLQANKTKQDLASGGDSTLKDCITLFGQPEKLDEQNAWYCPQCQDMRLALKQLHISRFPKFLIIQLSRFKNGANGKVKNSQPITYNQFETFGGQKYRLESAIIHEGSIEGGHYWAICRRQNQFYIFNDQKISKTDKICNKNAYILCYKKQQDQKLQK